MTAPACRPFWLQPPHHCAFAFAPPLPGADITSLRVFVDIGLICLTALQVTRVYCCGAMSTGIAVHVGIGLICLTVLQVTRVY